MNVYRSIGGRADASGIERVDRDGKIEVVSPENVEVTPLDRMKWYEKAKIDTRGNIPEEIFEVEQDLSSGTNMRVTVESRTSQPKPRQYSTESRLDVQRGEKISFPVSVGNRDNAVGIMAGAIIPDRGVQASSETKKTSSAKMSKDSTKFRLASAFEKIAKASVTTGVTPKLVASVSKEFGVSVEDVCMLERVASANIDLAEKYAGIRDPRVRVRSLKRKNRKCCQDIPGTEKNTPGNMLEKSSDDDDEENDELYAKKLKETAIEVGLVD